MKSIIFEIECDLACWIHATPHSCLDDATSHAGYMRPRILVWMMRPRMLDTCDPTF